MFNAAALAGVATLIRSILGLLPLRRIWVSDPVLRLIKAEKSNIPLSWLPSKTMLVSLVKLLRLTEVSWLLLASST